MPDGAGTPSLRVVLCDDAVGFPELVDAWLTMTDGMELVARTDTASALLELLSAAAADVVLLDFMLPEGPTSAALVEQVRALLPEVRVVLVSSLPALQLEDEARRLGADAWCPKAATSDQLVDAVLGR